MYGLKVHCSRRENKRSLSHVKQNGGWFQRKMAAEIRFPLRILLIFTNNLPWLIN